MNASATREFNLVDWCNKRHNPDTDHDDLQLVWRLFRARCQRFLQERAEHGFSGASYAPASAPTLRITESTDFGARAFFGKDGAQTVEVDEGTLSFLLWACLKSAMTLPVGRSVEAPPTGKRAPGRNAGSLGIYDVPTDPTRRALAFELAFLCFAFIVFHEVGHLAQGHCTLIRTGFYDYGSADDQGGPSESIERDPTRCALEFMADQFATRELIVYLRSVRDEVFPGGIKGGPLNERGEACWFCFADPLWAPAIPFVLLGIVFHFTSSTSPRHPATPLRLLASLRACHQLIPMHLGMPVTEATFQIAMALQRGIDDVLLPAAPDGVPGWTGVAAFPVDSLDDVQAELDRLHQTRRELEPMLQPHAQGPAAFLKYGG